MQSDPIASGPDLPAQNDAPSERRGAGGSAVPGWIAVFLASFALYAATANRGVGWVDSGERLLRVMVKDPVGTLGLALSHPLHHYLGRLAVMLPGGLEPALAVTLVSALGGALAVANVFGCVWSLTHRWWPALFAAMSLALAATFWQLATLTETYTVGAALLAGECWCLVAFVRGRRAALWGMFLLNGLGVSNHLLGGLTAPVLVFAVLLAWRRGGIKLQHLAIAAVLWCIGSLPYAALVASQLLRTGDWGGTIRSALFGTVYKAQVLNTHVSIGLLARGLLFIAYNFPNLLVPAAVLGILRSGRLDLSRWVRRLLLADLLVHAIFVLRYNVEDQQTFFLPLYVMLCIFGGLGAAVVMTWTGPARRRAITVAVVMLVATPLVYVAAPAMARRAGILEKYPRRPYRDSYTYALTPWGVAEPSGERMATEAVRLAGPDGIIVYADRMGAFALDYKAMRSGCPELKVQSLPSARNVEGRRRFAAAIRRSDGTMRSIVLVPTDVREPAPDAPSGYAWSRRGEFFMLVPAGTGTAPTASSSAWR